jgi:hypothetical protein
LAGEANANQSFPFLGFRTLVCRNLVNFLGSSIGLSQGLQRIKNTNIIHSALGIQTHDHSAQVVAHAITGIFVTMTRRRRWEGYIEMHEEQLQRQED